MVGFGLTPPKTIHPQNQNLLDISGGMRARRSARAANPGPNQTVAGMAPPPANPLGLRMPPTTQGINFQDQARTQFGLPTSAGSGATPNLMGGGSAFGGAAVRPVGGRPTFVDAQPVGPYTPPTRSPGIPRLKNRLSPEQLAKNAESTKAARKASFDLRHANVVANAKERRALRQERIAQKKNPQVANRFFGNQQELAMQQLKNQGAIGVAEQNARGEIAGKEALANFRNAQLDVEKAKAGIMPAQSPTGPAAAPLPGLETSTATSAPAMPAEVNAQARQQAADGDPEGAKRTLRANGVPEDKANEVVGALIGDPAYGMGFWERPVWQFMPGQVTSRGEALRRLLFPFTARPGTGPKKSPEKPKPSGNNPFFPFMAGNNPFSSFMASGR